MELPYLVHANSDILNRVFNHPNSSFAKFLSDYKYVLGVLDAVIIISIVIILIRNIVNFGRGEDNPRVRYEAKAGLFWCMLSLGLMGMLNVIFAFLIRLM